MENFIKLVFIQITDTLNIAFQKGGVSMIRKYHDHILQTNL